ncbi:hypothetical protein [Trueperella pyogenes]
MTEHVWPTAPVIEAQWVPNDRQPLSMHYGVFIRYPDGDYWNAPYSYTCSPNKGHFEEVTAFAPAEALEKRTAEVRKLEKALTRKNARLREYKESLRKVSEKRKEAYRAGRKAERRAQAGKPHARIYRVGSGWKIFVHHGASACVYSWQPTHADAMKWVENELKELANDPSSR